MNNDNGVIIQKVNDTAEALTNAVCLNLEIHGVKPNRNYFLKVGDKIHYIIHRPTLDDRTILMNSIQRRENDRMQIRIRSLRDQMLTREEMDKTHNPTSMITVFITRVFSKKSDDFYSIPEISREEITEQIDTQLRMIHYLRNNQSFLIALNIGCDEIHCQVQTSNTIYSNYRFYPTKSHTRIDVVNRADKLLTIRDQNLFNIKDIIDMGVGGLSSQFDEMFRRAFASRTLDPMTANALGVEHIRGIMLYGPPGCGKTLIARQISQSMNSVEPIIINGPELMSKYVGESEENLRKVFEAAEKEYKLLKDASKLHVIIFDEIDSICTHRGSNSGSTGVGDRIVNQLLTKLDGVNELNNIMVVGLTNRIDLIDKALLRPGRFEVQIEIGLPDKKGRIEILNIHTEKLRKNRCLDPSISIEDFAELTANYTGAELKGVINSARSYALCRAIDIDDVNKDDKSKKKSTKSANRSRSNEKGKETTSNQPLKVMVTYSDLMMALREVTPAFGKDQVISGIESGLSTYGIYDFAPGFHDQYQGILDRLERFNSSRSNTAIITISGSKGSGKTTLALDIAKKTEYPMVRFIDQSKLVGLNEYTLSSKLSSEFDEVSNSQNGVIILDDLERLIGFTNPSRYRESVLTSLLTLLDKLEKIGDARKYVIIITGTIDVIDHITDPRSNQIDPRSIKGRIVVPELPLFVKSTSNEKIQEFGYENMEDYLGKVRDIQAKIACTTNMKCMRFSHYDLFQTTENDTSPTSLPYSSIPIKYYIDICNDALIKYSEEIQDD